MSYLLMIKQGQNILTVTTIPVNHSGVVSLHLCPRVNLEVPDMIIINWEEFCLICFLSGPESELRSKNAVIFGLFSLKNLFIILRVSLRCNQRNLFIPLCRPKTTIAEIFAIMRQWVPQVQQNIEMLMKQVRGSSYFSYVNCCMSSMMYQLKDHAYQ